MQTKKTISGTGAAHLIGFGRKGIFMNQEGAGGGAGGAGGGTGQPGAGGQGGAGAGQSALSEDAKKEVADLINAQVNGAMNNHLTRFKKQFTEEIGQTLAGSLNPISEQLKTFGQTIAALKQAPAGGEGGGGQGQIPQEVRDAMLRQEAQIKELTEANKREREARETERNTRLREEERTTLANSLRNAGLPDHAIKAAVALLHTEDKRVARAEDGRIVFKFERGTGAAKYVDELEVDKGVGEWLKTDEGKGFVPARPAQGAGGQPARPGQRPANPNEAKAQATTELAKILLGGGIG